MAGKNLDLGTLIRQFEVHNRSEGKSLRTVEWYNQALGLFLEWLRGEGIPASLDRLGEDEARAFILHLQNRAGVGGKQSSSTVNNRVAGPPGLLCLAAPAGLYRGTPPQGPAAAQGRGEGHRNPDPRGDRPHLRRHGPGQRAGGPQHRHLLPHAGHRATPHRDRHPEAPGRAHRGPLRQGPGKGKQRAPRGLRGGLPAGPGSLRLSLPGGARPPGG